MSVIRDLLKARCLPPLGFGGIDPSARREELLQILADNIYGRTPDFVSEVSAKETFSLMKTFGGKAAFIRYELTVTTPGGDFSFPLYLTYPLKKEKVPLIVNISFLMDRPSGTVPAEEIVERGVALARFCYMDVTADTDDGFSSGLAPLFPREADGPHAWGKIGMWAWAASRALDFLLTLNLFDTARIGVLGHSRLGKTALWCGAQDSRFTHVFSNNAGCSGDAITRGKVGEQIERIYRVFPHWFCERYNDYSGDGIENMPFDQHSLLAAIAPRKVAVGASELDEWADPVSEYLCCFAAADAWESRGFRGFIAPEDRLPSNGDCFDEGNVAFHQRAGEHWLGREDWNAYIDFLLK